ncbi:MAG: hypothetical protein Q4C58_03315 [Eubacteriales bacterium]|nr:hypothetical protein [Eubacteriales bacterium]
MNCLFLLVLLCCCNHGCGGCMEERESCGCESGSEGREGCGCERRGEERGGCGCERRGEERENCGCERRAFDNRQMQRYDDSVRSCSFDDPVPEMGQQSGRSYPSYPNNQ